MGRLFYVQYARGLIFWPIEHKLFHSEEDAKRWIFKRTRENWFFYVFKSHYIFDD